MAIDISQFYQVFFEESREHLDEIEQLLLKLDVENPNIDQLNAVFRAAHSIKGGSATFGFNDMTAVTHVLESILDRLRKKEIALQTAMIDVFLQATDVIKLQLNGHIKAKPADPAIIETITAQLLALCADIKPMLPTPAQETKADDDFGFFDAEPAEKVDDGFGFFELETTPSSATKPAPTLVTEPAVIENRRQDRRASDRRGDDSSAESNSIRVNIDKVDQLINLVGELVISEAMLTQSLSNAPPSILQAISANLAQLERNTRDLQESVMSIRMMPISNLFNRFPRLVRDIAAKLNKEVELVTLGDETELDKSLIERIADPLTHLIRNSLDHGIESPKQRVATGKPAKGKIILSAMHQGGSIVIDVIDDGAGLNRDKIISKAKQRGIALPSTITDEHLWNIIAEPGFSTADSVTDISGRGVGMDVVNRNIADMGGEIFIETTEAQGCKISIRLPLTLAILDGMTVSLGDNLFVIPLNAITETLQPKLEDLKSVANAGSMVNVRGEYVPIIALHKTFNIATEVIEPTQGMLVIVEAYGKKAALLLDSLVGQQQVVIKSLETNFRKINGISSATILGDGTVALIIDVPSIIKLGQH
jgi:two-component system, chemotaxis family, sensor kinase CheA